jgi:hypothetical protein
MRKILVPILLLIGVLGIGPRGHAQVSTDSLISALCQQVNADSIYGNILTLQDFGSRHALNPNRDVVANWVLAKFHSIGLTNAYFEDFPDTTVFNFHDTVYTNQHNIIAMIPGIEHPEKVIIFGAHYDSYSGYGYYSFFAPGANDNATGMAALFEIARIFTENDFKPKCTIKFIAFAAEEMGLKGSNYSAKKSIANGENIFFMLCNEVIGSSNSSADWNFKTYSFSHTIWLEDLAVLVSSNFTSATANITYYQAQEISDDLSYSHYGIPTLWMNKYDHYEYYHTENDLIEFLRMDYCSELIKVSLAIITKADQDYSSVSEFTSGHIQFTCFPNPVKDILNIRLSGLNSDFDLFIYSSDGRQVFSQENLHQGSGLYNNSLDLSVYPAGMYLVRIKSRDECLSGKFLKQ